MPEILGISAPVLSINFTSSIMYAVLSAFNFVVTFILNAPVIPMYPFGALVSSISNINSCPSVVIAISPVVNVPSPLFVTVTTSPASVLIVNSAPGSKFPSSSTLFMFKLNFPSVFWFSTFKVIVLSINSYVTPGTVGISAPVLSINFTSSIMYAVLSAFNFVVTFILNAPVIPMYPFGALVSSISNINSCPSVVIAISPVVNVPSPLFVTVTTSPASVLIVNSAPGSKFPSSSTLFMFKLNFPSVFWFSTFKVIVLSINSYVTPGTVGISAPVLSRNFISSTMYPVPVVFSFVVIFTLNGSTIPIYPPGTFISSISNINSSPSDVIAMSADVNVPSPLFVTVITLLSSVIIVNAAPGSKFPSSSTLFMFKLNFPSNISSFSTFITGWSSASANHNVAVVLYILSYVQFASIFTSVKSNSADHKLDIFK